MIAPGDHAARAVLLLHRDVCHEASGRGTVPVALTSFEEHAVTWADLLDGCAFALTEPGDVRFHRSGRKRLRHPIVGELELSYETMTLDGDEGLRLALFTAEAGTFSQQALDLLASWSATPAEPGSPILEREDATPPREA